MSDELFQRIEVHEWRQFRNVEIDFSEKVTILTGRNGTGKTTILNILAQHSAYSSQFLGAPAQARDSLGRYTSGVWDSFSEEPTQAIGSIKYMSGSCSEIRVGNRVEVGFDATLSPKIALSVLNIPSHRRLTGYKKVETIPTDPIGREQALHNYQSEFWNSARGGVSRTTPLTKMKEALVSMQWTPGDIAAQNMVNWIDLNRGGLISQRAEILRKLVYIYDQAILLAKEARREFIMLSLMPLKAEEAQYSRVAICNEEALEASYKTRLEAD